MNPKKPISEVRISEAVNANQNSWHSLIQTSLIAFLAFCLLPSSFASYATNWFGEGNGSTNTITVNFKPTGTPFVLPNGQTIISYAFSVTATNGILASTYLAPGPWSATFGGSFDTWKLNVPYDNNTYALWQLATNVNALTNFPTITEIIYNEGAGGSDNFVESWFYTNGGGQIDFYSSTLATVAALAAQGQTITNVFATQAQLASQGTAITNWANATFATITALGNQGTAITNWANATFATITALGSQGTAITNWANATFATISALTGQGTAITNAYTALCTVVSNGIVAWGNATFQPLASPLTTLSGNAAANSVWGNATGSAGAAAFTSSPHFGGDVGENTAIVTNLVTNLSLTASTPVVANANKALASGSVGAPITFTSGNFGLNYDGASLVLNGSQLELAGASGVANGEYYGYTTGGGFGWYTPSGGGSQTPWAQNVNYAGYTGYGGGSTSWTNGNFGQITNTNNFTLGGSLITQPGTNITQAMFGILYSNALHASGTPTVALPSSANSAVTLPSASIGFWTATSTHGQPPVDCAGTISITNGNHAGTNGTVGLQFCTVTFSTPYINPPVVTIAQGTNTSDTVANARAIVGAAFVTATSTTTGFTIFSVDATGQLLASGDYYTLSYQVSPTP
jgi:hypothetical protein